MARWLTCGVLVTDMTHLLLGHATGSPRWDIPKGLAEPDETPIEAALRELAEETALTVDPGDLKDLGRHPYLSAKDLALFAWVPREMPDPSRLFCASCFTARNGRVVPEFDRFAVFSWQEALGRVGRNMARVLNTVHPHIAGGDGGELDPAQFREQ